MVQMVRNRAKYHIFESVIFETMKDYKVSLKVELGVLGVLRTLSNIEDGVFGENS